ncbi:tartrate dehydrogenase [Pelomyxa schiedti]|nr:tartrate dehydrogenase [Pelomyxa schiedti]
MAAVARKHKVAIYPGDGIGIEVIDETLKSLAELERAARGSFVIEATRFDWGLTRWRATGEVAPPDFLEVLKKFDAILFGALGDPRVLPDHLTLTPLIQMRQKFDQYVCLRPAKLLPGVPGPLPGPIDIAIVRENSEGEYATNGGHFKMGTPDEIALETSIHTRKGVERIIRYAFQLARKRSRHVTLATKSNAIKYGMVMWDKIFDSICKEFPDVRSDKFHVDALSMNFVRCPQDYDVVVGSNLFGDILSDLGGAISGSLGLAPSANINPERTFPSLFEPVHGSALDIAGKGLANPIGALRCLVMMLEFLGETQSAQLLDRAIADNLLHGPKTPDIGGKATTSQVGDDVAQRVRVLAATNSTSLPHAKL